MVLAVEFHVAAPRRCARRGSGRPRRRSGGHPAGAARASARGWRRGCRARRAGSTWRTAAAPCRGWRPVRWASANHVRERAVADAARSARSPARHPHPSRSTRPSKQPGQLRRGRGRTGSPACSAEPGRGAVEDEGAGRAPGAGRRRAWPSRAPSETPRTGGLLRARRVHDGPQVVHPVLERAGSRRPGRTGRCPRLSKRISRLNDASPSRQPTQARLLPDPLEVGDETGGHDEVQVAGPDDLVGDGRGRRCGRTSVRGGHGVTGAGAGRRGRG